MRGLLETQESLMLIGKEIGERENANLKSRRPLLEMLLGKFNVLPKKA